MADTEIPARPRRLLRWRRWLPRAVFESLLIVLSLLLALALGDWAQERRTEERLQQARGHFVAEITANRDMLKSPAFLGHHIRLRDIFRDAYDEGGSEKAQAAFDALFETGIHSAPLRDAVWRGVGSGSLLGEMPLTETFLLSDIYRAQDRLDRANEQFSGAVLLKDMTTPAGERAAVTAVLLHLGDVLAAESDLVRQYDRALAALGDAPATARTGDADAPAR